jgi:glycosyltransferase involved in cell wall biosynthesis
MVQILGRVNPKLIRAMILTEANGAEAHRDVGAAMRVLTWDDHRGSRRGLAQVIDAAATGLYRLLCLGRLMAAIDREQPSIVVAASMFLYDSLPVCLWRSRSKHTGRILIAHLIAPPPHLGYSATIHFPSLSETSLWLNNLLSIVLGKIVGAHFVAVHQRIASALITHYHVDPHSVTVIPVGVTKVGCRDEVKDIDVLFLGRKHPQKGLRDLVRVWKMIRARLPDARLLIVGQTTAEVQGIFQCNLESAGVTAAGYVTDIEKSGFLCRAKALIFPSHFEGYPAVAIEALAHGTPVVAYDLPQLLDLRSKGITLVPRFDYTLLADAVAGLLTTHRELSDLAGLARSSSFDDWSASALSYQTLLTRLA